MVVLSACQTALAEPDQNGIEITSLAHKFIDAGVDTVVASLWLVDDQSTRLLMEAFYKALAESTEENSVTISQALQIAQLSLLGEADATASQNNTSNPEAPRGITIEALDEEALTTPASSLPYAHPYYWAPFIIIGNGL